MKCLTFITICFFTSPAFAIEYKATYDMIWNVGITLEAEATETLKKNGDRYQMELDVKASIGSANETTNLLFNPKFGWKPLDYAYTQSVLGRTTGRQFRFNWNKASLSRLHEPERGDETITENMLDPLSFRLTIAHSLRRQQILPISFPMLDGNKIKVRTLKNLGAESVVTPLGSYTAIKFSLEDQYPDPTRVFLFWLAPELNYQLVKLEKKDKKRRLALILRTYEASRTR